MSSEAANIMTEVHVTSVPDICLVCPSGDSSIKIFANIAVLRNASPVFHSMLGPHFLEGQAIANNPGPSLYELRLPEDSAQGMLLLMQIIHLNYQQLPRHLEHDKYSMEEVRGAAILADKYDLCLAMSLVLHLCIDCYNIPFMKHPKDLWSILSMSYIVCNLETFKASSARLLEYHNEAYHTLIGDGMTHESDMWISALLEEKRGKLRAMVSTRLLQGMENIRYHTEAGDHNLAEWVNTEMPRVAYNDSLEKTRSMLDTFVADYANEDPDVDFFEGISRNLSDGIQSGICFACVGSRGKHGVGH